MQIELPDKHRLHALRWIGLTLLLLMVVTTAAAAASLPTSTGETVSWTVAGSDPAVGDQYRETIESKIFHTGYRLSFTYQSDGQWHPDTIIVWTPRIQQENPHKYLQAPYEAGNNAENYRKIVGWTQKVHDIDTAAAASLSHNQQLLRKAIFPGIFVDGPVSTTLRIFGIIEKTKAELNVYSENARQYINNIYGSAMMMEGGF